MKFLILFFFLIFNALNNYSQTQERHIDSLNQIINNNLDLNDTTLVNLYNNISALFYQTNPDTTLSICKENINRIDYLLKYSKKDYSPRERKSITIAKTVALNNIAVISLNKGNSSEALKYFLSNLKVNKQLKKNDMVVVTLLNIAKIYYDQTEYNKAIKFAKESLDYIDSKSKQVFIGLSCNRIGNSYFKTEQLDSSFYYYQKAINIFDSLGLSGSLAETYNYIGVVQLSKNNFLQALKTFNKADSINKTDLDYNLKIFSDYYIGRAYFGLNQLKKSEIHTLESLKHSIVLNNLNQITKCNKLLYEIYQKQNKHNLALKYYKDYVTNRDSLENKENQKLLLKQQAKFEYNIKATEDSIRQIEALKVVNLKIETEIAKNENQQIIIQKNKTERIYLFVGLFLIGIFSLFLYNRFRVIRKQKNKIEQQEKTVSLQHKELEEIHNDVQSSIKYAKGLQDAILPSENDINSVFKQNFLIFNPKDIVSGDFYWLEKRNNITFLAIADCTGHGIPGSMVSIVCSSALTRAVKEFNLTSTAEILNKTKEIVIDTFSKSGQNIQDGMDISLCAFENNILTYSGAYNPLWIIRNKEILEYKADRQPVGFYNNSKPFSQTVIELQNNDLIYLMTDGYHDQFGGENNKKFKSKNLKKLLLDISNLEMDIQKEKLSQTFKEWKGDIEQIDDVTLMGIKITSN